jgi:hypothetical protein
LCKIKKKKKIKFENYKNKKNKKSGYEQIREYFEKKKYKNNLKPSPCKMKKNGFLFAKMEKANLNHNSKLLSKDKLKNIYKTKNKSIKKHKFKQSLLKKKFLNLKKKCLTSRDGDETLKNKFNEYTNSQRVKIIESKYDKLNSTRSKFMQSQKINNIFYKKSKKQKYKNKVDKSIRIESLKLTSNKTLKKKSKIISLNNPKNCNQNRLILMRNDFLKKATKPHIKNKKQIKSNVWQKKTEKDLKNNKSKLIYSSIALANSSFGIKSKLKLSHKNKKIVNNQYLKDLKQSIKKPNFFNRFQKNFIEKDLKKERGVQWTSLDFKALKDEPIYNLKTKKNFKSPVNLKMKTILKRNVVSIDKPDDIQNIKTLKKSKKNNSSKMLFGNVMVSIYDKKNKVKKVEKKPKFSHGYIFRKMKTLNGYQKIDSPQNRSINIV